MEVCERFKASSKPSEGITWTTNDRFVYITRVGQAMNGVTAELLSLPVAWANLWVASLAACGAKLIQSATTTNSGTVTPPQLSFSNNTELLALLDVPEVDRLGSHWVNTLSVRCGYNLGETLQYSLIQIDGKLYFAVVGATADEGAAMAMVRRLSPTLQAALASSNAMTKLAATVASPRASKSTTMIGCASRSPMALPGRASSFLC
jgi:hypothetical protein